jgi:hypothetical protein
MRANASSPFVGTSLRAQLLVPLLLGVNRCRSYMVCQAVPGSLCLLSLVGYLLGDLPVSGLHCSEQGPALPASHQSRSSVVEHLRGQIHPRVTIWSIDLFYRRRRKTESGSSTLDENRCYHVAAIREIGYNTSVTLHKLCRSTHSSAPCTPPQMTP